MEVADMIYMRNMITLGKANIPQAVVTGENIPLGGFVPSTPTVNTEEALWGVGGLAAWAFCELHTNIDQIGQKKGPLTATPLNATKKSIKCGIELLVFIHYRKRQGVWNSASLQGGGS